MANKPDHVKQRAFLGAFAECGNITAAAKLAQVHRATHHRWLANDPEYKLAFRHAKKEACDALEAEARRRAFEGVNEPVFYKGEVCGTVRKYSDLLLIFLLKGNNPRKFRELTRLEHTGAKGGPIQVEEGHIDELIREQLARIKAKAREEVEAEYTIQNRLTHDPDLNGNGEPHL